MRNLIQQTATGAPWYVLQTRSKMERVAATGLLNKGYEVFLPMQQPMKKRRHDEPLFPCYVFCRGRSKDFKQFLSAPGAVRLLGCSGKPEAISEAELQSVRGIARSESIQ
jgi:transcription antitermination factor NusG